MPWVQIPTLSIRTAPPTVSCGILGVLQLRYLPACALWLVLVGVNSSGVLPIFCQGRGSTQSGVKKERFSRIAQRRPSGTLSRVDADALVEPILAKQCEGL
ncbi:hypothetical protein CBR_g24108 [Chara braunii]|uniref:Uncharacterized protein n=1 Tax=Chara braunii TaxID=69332 RepID=A0A388L5S8_CHABU|nr:hypothetical protein CBR_g24108 [Chara braunii]|eukprot:GBG77661.1 hypothetical protein CBR_g24108 [Chara braunii]